MIALDKPAQEAAFEFPDRFNTPDVSLPNGLIARLSAVGTNPDSESRMQAAMVFKEGDTSRHIHLLTLASSEDEPFEQFPDWLQRVTFHAQTP